MISHKYWTSWWSGNYEDEGCTAPPFKFWTSGEERREGDTDRIDLSICALIEAADSEEVWQLVEGHFPDYRARFCEQRDELTYEKLAESGRFV